MNNTYNMDDFKSQIFEDENQVDDKHFDNTFMDAIAQNIDVSLGIKPQQIKPQK